MALNANEQSLWINTQYQSGCVDKYEASGPRLTTQCLDRSHLKKQRILGIFRFRGIIFTFEVGLSVVVGRRKS